MKLYVASSWRNEHYDGVCNFLLQCGHRIWNWRQPPTGGNGFSWSQCGMEGHRHGDKVSVANWKDMLDAQPACLGFASDLCGMNWCEVGVLLHPCGRSAHLEAGWLAGRGKRVHILALEPVEPDLMVLALNGEIFDNTVSLAHWLEKHA